MSDESNPASNSAKGRDRERSLKERTARGVLWNFVARFGQQGIQLLVMVVLARLLLPEDFGAIGILTVFIAVSNAISDGGFGKSLIQKQDADQLDESSMFYFNLAVSCVLWVIIYFLAPLVAWIYQADELTWLLRILSLNVIFAAFSMVQVNVLTRALNFRALLVANWTATVTSGAIGIGLAWCGYGVWSLVGQMVSMQVVRSIMLWCLDAWRPTWQFSFQRLFRMLPFGSNLLAAAILDAIYQNLYLLVIGLYYSKAQVGYYRQAHSLQVLPMGNFLMAVNHVTFPALARVQTDRERLKRGLREAFRLTAFSMFSVMALMAAVADPLIPVVFSDKWRPAIPYFQLLCAVGALVPLQSANLNAFRAIGQSGAVLRTQLLRKGLTLATIFFTASWGVEAMICGQIAALSLSTLQVSWVSRQLLDYRYAEQVSDVAGIAMITVFSGAVTYFSGWWLPGPDWVRLLLQLSIGGICIVALSSVTRLTAWHNAWNVLRLFGSKRAGQAYRAESP